MAADNVLVKGAFEAERAKQDEDLALARSMMGFIENAKTWKIRNQQKQQEVNEAADEAIASEGELTDEDLKNTKQDVTDGQEQYLNGDEDAAIRAANQLERDLLQHSENVDNMARGIKDKTLSNAFLDPDNSDANELMQMLRRDSTSLVTDKKTGRKGYIINGQFITVEAGANMIQYYDQSSADQLVAMGYRELANGENSEGVGSFDRDVISKEVLDIINNGDVSSIAMDSMFRSEGGYSNFLDDTIAEIQNYTFSQLGMDDATLIKHATKAGMNIVTGDGLNDEERKAIIANRDSSHNPNKELSNDLKNFTDNLKIDSSDGIDETEARVIMTAMKSNEAFSSHFKTELVNYMTNSIENQYNKGTNKYQEKTRLEFNKKINRIKLEKELFEETSKDDNDDIFSNVQKSDKVNLIGDFRTNTNIPTFSSLDDM